MIVYSNFPLLHVCGAQNAAHSLFDCAPNCKRTVDVIRSFSVSAGRTVTSTSADSAAPAEASFRMTTKNPPLFVFLIFLYCKQQIFLDKSRLYPLY